VDEVRVGHGLAAAVRGCQLRPVGHLSPAEVADVLADVLKRAVVGVPDA